MPLLLFVIILVFQGVVIIAGLRKTAPLQNLGILSWQRRLNFSLIPLLRAIAISGCNLSDFMV